MIAIDVMQTLSFCGIDRQISWIHSQQVWLSGYKPQRSNQTMPIFMKALPDLIVIDVTWSLCSIDCQIGYIQIQQVWVSGYKPQRNNQMTLLFMKALPE